MGRPRHIEAAILIAGILLWGVVRFSLAQEDERENLPSLDLPSVEIYGKERIEFPIEGDKRTESKQFRFPADLNAKAKRGEEPEVRDMSPKISRGTEVIRSSEGEGMIRAEAGSFSSWGGALQYADRGGRLGVLFELRHNASGGHVDTAAYRTTDLGAKGVFAGTPHTRVPFELHYENGKRELWGAAPSFERTWHQVHGEIGLDLFRPKGMRAEFRLGAASGRLEDDGGDEAEERSLYAALNASVFTGSVLLDGTVKYSGDNLSLASEAAGLLETSACGKFSIGERLNLKVGARFFHASTYTDTSLSKVYPFGELEYVPTSYLKLRARYDPRILRTSLFDLHARVPVIALDTDLLPREDEHRVEMGAEIGGDRMKLRLLGRMERGEVEIWRELEDRGLWRAEIEDAEVRSVRVGCRVVPVKEVRLSGWGMMRDMDEELPYVSESEVGADLRLGAPDRFEAIASFRRVGKRPTDVGIGATNTKDELGSYAILNVRLSKAIGEHLVIFIRGTDLLDDEYEIWRGYVEPGRGLYGGLEAKW